MREHRRAQMSTAGLAGILFAFILMTAVLPAMGGPPAAATDMPCRVLEAETSQRFGMAIVIFHYRDAADRERLGALLREYNGAIGQFSTADGHWHTATVLRLKTCFGRGLLLFPSDEAHLAAHDQFVLKFTPTRTR